MHGHEEVPADGQSPEHQRWLRLYNAAGESPNKITCEMGIVSRPGVVKWPLVMRRSHLENVTVRLPDFACLVFGASLHPIEFRDIVFQGAKSCFLTNVIIQSCSRPDRCVFSNGSVICARKCRATFIRARFQRSSLLVFDQANVVLIFQRSQGS